MNFKPVAVVVSLLALQCLAITSDELLQNFALMENNLLLNRQTVENAIEGYLSLLNDSVNASESTLNSELENASQPFWDSINVLTIKAAEHDKDISTCTNNIFNEFVELQNAALEKAKKKILIIYETGVEQLSEVTDSLTNADKEFKKLLQKFTSDCSDTCATELNSELIQFYQSALSEIDTALEAATEYIFNTASNELASSGLDTDQLQSDYQELIDYVEACVDA